MAAGEATIASLTYEGERVRVRRLAGEGLSVELIARAVSRSRYFVERILDTPPAGRSDVPYRHRLLRATSNVARRYRSGQSAEDIAHTIGVSVTTVFDWLRDEGVELRGKSSGPHLAPTFAATPTS